MLLQQNLVVLAEGEIASVRKILRIVTVQKDLGLTTPADVERAQTRLDNVRSQLLDRQSALEQARNAYKRLTNHMPLRAAEVPAAGTALPESADVAVDLIDTRSPRLAQAVEDRRSLDKQYDSQADTALPRFGLKLGIKYAPFKVEIADVDVVLVFTDGSRIIIPGMALAAFSGRKPVIQFPDKEFSSDQAVGMVGEISPQTPALELHLSSADSTKPADDAKAPAAVQPEDAAQAQAEEAAKQEKQHKSGETGKALTEKISDSQPQSPSTPGVQSPRAADPAPDDALGPAGIGKLVPKLTFTLTNTEGVTRSTENGETVITGNTGGPDSSKNTGFRAQSAPESIEGTSAGDVIFADDPAKAPQGTSFRVLNVVAEVPAKGLDLLEVLIPSLPPGYGIVNGTLTDKGWLVKIDQGKIEKLTTTTDETGLTVTVPASQSHFSFELELTYTLPPTGTEPSSSGFKDEFFFPVLLGLSSDGETSTFAVSVSTHFGIKDVTDEGGMTVTAPVTGEPIYVLFANPPGTTIAAGAGDDRIYAGAGADSIDGGSGSDFADYSLSGEGVDADLGSGKGKGGAAEGDSYSNVEGLIGSDFADRLIGDAGDNTLIGGKGADVLDGGAGSDTADYSDALDGAPEGTAGQRGDAAGDSLSGVESVIGSSFGDMFTLALGYSFSIDGGGGSDSVAIAENAGAVSSAQLASVLSRVETIDFTASGTNANLTVDAAFIQGVAGAGNASQLTLAFDAGDTLQIANGAFYTQTGNDYTFYSDSSMTTTVAQLTVA